MTAAAATGSGAVVRSKWRTWRRRAVRGVIAAACVCVVAAVSWEVALRTVPYPQQLGRYPRGATIVEDREGRELAAFVGQEDAWYVPLESAEISPHLKKAIIAVEDRRFMEHGGIDWRSVMGAMWEDVTALGIRRGASTIDMQVHRLRDPRRRSFWAKVEQAFRAEQIDRMSSKDAILTEYINRAPFGGNLVGAGAASWRYFGKPSSALSLGQAALLAGLPQSPNRFRPDRAPEKAAARRGHVLEQMLAAGMISQAEFQQANSEPVEAAWRALPQDLTHHAWGALPALAGAEARAPGRHVRTTIDAAIQSAAWQATSSHLKMLASSGIDSAAVIVVDVASGEIRASVSLSDSASSVDLTRSPRSTGSVLKPFIYACAFDMGILTPASDLFDSPKAWAGYAPSNYDKAFRGHMAAADALAESRNIPAMLVLSKVGIERAIGVLEESGIRTPGVSSRRYGLSLAIGGGEATPVEIAEGYATLARGGTHIPLHLTASARPADRSTIFPETVCWQTLQCINGRARTESVDGGSAAAALSAAWKTGTSNGLRDAWCAAATPRLVVVAWLGNSGGRGASALVGQEVAAPLSLKLIGALDKGGAPFPTSQPAQSAPQLAANTRLSILAPAPDAEFLLETETQRQQNIALKSAGGSGAKRWWFANGNLVATSNAGETSWWSAGPGKYELRVVDEAGHGRGGHLRVR